MGRSFGRDPKKRDWYRKISTRTDEGGIKLLLLMAQKIKGSNCTTIPLPGPRIQDDSLSGWPGLAVPLTKQESQTLVPFLSVKSTLRPPSISTPQHPH